MCILDNYSYDNLKRKKECVVCSRKITTISKKYCLLHSEAFDSIQKKYNSWYIAYGGISWVDYLNKLLEIDETGSWIKEVSSAELKESSI